MTKSKIIQVNVLTLGNHIQKSKKPLSAKYKLDIERLLGDEDKPGTFGVTNGTLYQNDSKRMKSGYKITSNTMYVHVVSFCIIVTSEHRQPKLTFRAVGRYKLVLRNTRPLRIL